MAILVEVLNAQHKVVERHKFNQQHIRLGRAYDNDVILFDKHVCPHHASLSQDEQGHWQLEDLSSVNGSYLAGRKAVLQKEPLRSGEICWLGEQALRLYDDQHQVAPALPLSLLTQRLALMGHGLLILLFALLIAAEHIGTVWLTLPTQLQQAWPVRLLEIPKSLLMFCLWPALLALWSRFHQQDSFFLPQLGMTYAAIAASAVWGLLCFWIGFNSDGAGWAAWLEVLGYSAIFWLLFAGNIWLATQWRRRYQLLLATVLMALVSSQQWLQLLMPPSPYDRSLRYDERLLPAVFYLGQGMSEAAYQQQLDALFEADKQTESRP
ncbi:FHA domain-containing protein [Rheinheimera marina]|uniref:FHA domain-containing protein n=1 Tax=Rheinheimera marina TaxID=1774958 RepID=A0ABV9JFJ4_9GAMM